LIRKLFSLSASDLPLLGQALAIVLAVRLCLWLVPSRVLLRYVSRRVARAVPVDAVDARVRRIGWAVRAASRRVPQATCLTQALSAQLLLAREGYASTLRIGVSRQEQIGFAAHAWLEIGGCTLIGGQSAHLYRPLPDVLPVL
jgi:hypothetical protein